VVGFLGRYAIQEYNYENLEEQSEIPAKDLYCIHTVQLKILENLIPDNEETSKSLFLFLCIIYEICMCSHNNANTFL